MFSGNAVHIGSVDRSVNSVQPTAQEPGWERIRVQVDSGAIDTVTPKETAQGIPLKPTEASKSGKAYMAANGSRVANYGEKRVVGYTDDWTGISIDAMR